LAYVTGLVNQRLLLQNEYLAAENRILWSLLPSRPRLSDPQRSTLAEIGKRLGRKELQQVACVAKPDTILGWYRRLIARKFDGSRKRAYPGRPSIDATTEALIVRMASENSGWGYDRIVGALANLGHDVSDQTVGNVLARHGIAPAPKRSQNTTWKDFIGAEPESECLRGKVGALRQRGMPVQIHPVRRSFAATGLERVHRPLSFGTKPSR
jgi:putative transposase